MDVLMEESRSNTLQILPSGSRQGIMVKVWFLHGSAVLRLLS